MARLRHNGRYHFTHAVSACKRSLTPRVGNVKLVNFKAQVVLGYIIKPGKNLLLEMSNMGKIGTQ